MIRPIADVTSIVHETTCDGCLREDATCVAIYSNGNEVDLCAGCVADLACQLAAVAGGMRLFAGGPCLYDFSETPTPLPGDDKCLNTCVEKFAEPWPTPATICRYCFKSKGVCDCDDPAAFRRDDDAEDDCQ
jgi:hypothetical protein